MDYQYYPTPIELGKRLAKMFDKANPPILEPSAGTGNLIQAVIEANKPGRHWKSLYSEENFHCVELNANRAASLKGLGLKVVWDDFLTFHPLMAYPTIIMNPPFHDGAKHLQHALDILADGGQLACILNAETIKNPFSNERKALIQQLEEQDVYQCEFVQSAFEDTYVEVALIYVKKKPSPVRCSIFEDFKKSVVYEREQEDPQALMRYGEVDAMIDTYRASVKAALKLFDEINNFNLCINQSISLKEDFKEIFELKTRYKSRFYIVKKVNGIFWQKLLHSSELERLLTEDTRRAYWAKLDEMKEYEFNERNILQLKADLVKNLFDNVDVAVMKVWDEFTCRYNWSEYSNNIHYYNGWKTNTAFKCNKKIILPLNAYNNWSKSLEIFSIRDRLADIEKVMNYLDCGRTEDDDMAEKLQDAHKDNQTRDIDTKYFKVDLYKKGTAHLKFKDMELLKKFNLYCGKRKNWLPDDYGRKPYDSLNDEERAVADSFEGRDSYEDTFRNQQFYLPSNSSLLMLTEAKKI